MLRLGPPLTIVLLTVPIFAGLVGTIGPAFGYLPALGGFEFGFAPFRTLFDAPGIGRSATISLGLGVTSALISLIIVIGFVATSVQTRWFKLIERLISPLLSIPHAAAAFGFMFLIAPSGLIMRLVSPGITGWERPPDVLIVHDPYGLAMLAGLVIKEVPFLFLMALAALPQIRLVQARQTLASFGYGRISGFVLVIWPQIYRQIRLAVFAVIAFSSAVVDVAIILGPTTPAPLSVRLVDWAFDPDLSFRFVSAAGAVLQLAVTATALLLWLGLERMGHAFSKQIAVTGKRMRRDLWLQYLANLSMLLTAGAVLAGMGTLALWSVAGLWPFPDTVPQSLSSRHWHNALPRLYEPLMTTFGIAAASTALSSLLVVMCLIREDQVGRRFTQQYALSIIYLPLIVPQTAFLFGLHHMTIFLELDAQLSTLIFVHMIFVTPYVFLALSDPWRAFDNRYMTIASGLGKSRLATYFAIKLPMLLGAILSAMAVGFAISAGQYLPTLLIGSGRIATITTEAVALAAGGNRRIIGVYAFVQMLVPALGFMIALLVPALLFRRRRAMRAAL